MSGVAQWLCEHEDCPTAYPWPNDAVFAACTYCSNPRPDSDDARAAPIMALPATVGFAYALQHAINVAATSPCQKSQRGAVIWSPHLVGGFSAIDGLGCNAPPPGFGCDGSPACRDACSKVCVHAEAAALSYAREGAATGAEMLHIKLVDGRPVTSGPPSCWQCSRAIVDAEIAGVWLWHSDGWKRYGAAEFHEATLRTCGLPVIRGTR